uniref:Protein kinase domain-containing protein n=2 Tax=Hemiselmis andersenii TaxID=464988 RepID=A0A6U2I0Q6_HEMAN
MMQKGGFGYVFFGTYDATPNPNARPVSVEVCIKLPNEDPDSVKAHQGEMAINKKVAESGGIPGVADFIGTVDLNPIAAQLPPGIGSREGIVWRVVKGKTLDNFFDRGGGMSPVVANTLNIRSEPPTKIKGGVVYIKTALCEKVLGESLLPLAQLHERGIIHRDLKPRNIMLSERTPNTPLCIIDFGSAVTKGNRPFMNDYTEVYAPPEAPVPDGGNPFSYDIFTLGIVGLRVLMPSLIAGENGIATLGKVCVAEIPSYNYDIKAWASARANDPGGQFEFRALNKECEGLMQQPVLLELLSRMLSPNPRERPSAEECLRMLGPQWEAKLAQAKQGQQSRGNCGTCGQPVLSTDVGRFRDARGVYFHQQCQ